MEVVGAPISFCPAAGGKGDPADGGKGDGDEPPAKKQRISADAEKVAEEPPAAGGTATPDSSDSSVGADKDLKKVLKYLSRAHEKVQHLRQPLATLSRVRKRERNRQ